MQSARFLSEILKSHTTIMLKYDDQVATDTQDKCEILSDRYSTIVISI